MFENLPDEQSRPLEKEFPGIEFTFKLRNEPCQKAFIENVIGRPFLDPEITAVNSREIVGSLQRLVEHFSDNFDIHSEDLSDITRHFLSSIPLTQELEQGLRWEGVVHETWDTNEGIRRVVVDALLSRISQGAITIEDLKAIRSAREILRAPSITYYLGASSAVLEGVEQARGRILSLAKLKEKGIRRKTGEGLLFGSSADRLKRGISVARDFEVADSYGWATCEFYTRNPSTARKFLARTNHRITTYEEELVQPGLSFGERYSLERRLKYEKDKVPLLEEELVELSANTDQPEAKPYAIVFGFDKLPFVEGEEFFGCVETEHEISLSEKLRAVFVPAEYQADMEQWLVKMRIKGVEVFSLEVRRFVSSFDPVAVKQREKMENWKKGVIEFYTN